MGRRSALPDHVHGGVLALRGRHAAAAVVQRSTSGCVRVTPVTARRDRAMLNPSRARMGL